MAFKTSFRILVVRDNIVFITIKYDILAFMLHGLKKALLPVFLAAMSLSIPSLASREERRGNTPSMPEIEVGTAEGQEVALADSAVTRHISDTYNRISFNKDKVLSPEVFGTAMRGYLALKQDGALSTTKDILSICDFNLPSTKPRLWVIDLKSHTVLYSTYVAHGQGSGGLYARDFSNVKDSRKTSLGFYVTTGTYQGKYGLSLYLEGKDKHFNDAAMERQIVMHGAPYVSREFIRNNKEGYLGRSWGCPAVPVTLSAKIIPTIQDSTCLFVAFNSKSYLDKSVWLKKPIYTLPTSSVKVPSVNR